MITPYLNDLERLLKAENARCLHYLQNGIDLNVAEAPKEFSDMKKSPILCELFSWHNGSAINFTEPAEHFKVTPDFAPMSLEQINSILQIDRDYLFTVRRELPLFSSGHGEYLTVAYDDLMRDPDRAKISYVSTWNPELELYTEIYDSLPRFLETTLTCFEKGAYFIDGGIVEIDFDVEHEIGKKMNKKAKAYWARY